MNPINIFIQLPNSGNVRGEQLEAENARLRAVCTRLLDKVDELDGYNPPRWAGAPDETIPAELESIIIETLLIATDARAALGAEATDAPDH